MAKKTAVKIHFCIPPLKTQIILAAAWEFGLRFESRNKSLAKALGFSSNHEWGWPAGEDYNMGDEVCKVTMPKDTELSVERIYVRNGLQNFDSITFRVKDCPDPKFKKCRFWAKLAEVNKIICYPIFGDGIVHEAFASFMKPGSRVLEI